MNLSKPSTPRYTPNVFLTSLLRDHTDSMINRYSALRALRVDLWYQKGTLRFQQSDYRQLEHEVRLLMQEMMTQKSIVGYFWVIEWTQDHGWRAHVIFWLDEHITQTTWPASRKTSDIWSRLTSQEGGFYHCVLKEPYKADINIPVYYNVPASIMNIHQVLGYLAKEEQKDGLYLYGCNDIPPRPTSGRPRACQSTDTNVSWWINYPLVEYL